MAQLRHTIVQLGGLVLWSFCLHLGSPARAFEVFCVQDVDGTTSCQRLDDGGGSITCVDSAAGIRTCTTADGATTTCVRSRGNVFTCSTGQDRPNGLPTGCQFTGAGTYSCEPPLVPTREPGLINPEADIDLSPERPINPDSEPNQDSGFDPTPTLPADPQLELPAVVW